MNANGWRVADSDLHVMEPPDLWQRYIDPAYAHAAPDRPQPRSPATCGCGSRTTRCCAWARVRPSPDGAKAAGGPSRTTRYAAPRRGAGTRRRSSTAMDAEGLDMAVLFPCRGPVRARPRLASSRSGTDGLEPELRDRDRARVQRLAARLLRARRPTACSAPGMVAPHDVDRRGRRGAAAAWRSSGSRRSSCARAASTAGPWHHPATTRSGRESSASTCPISFHGGGQTYLTPDFALEVFDKLMLWHTFSQPLGIQFVTVSLCGGGVLERFPNLRVGAARRATARGRRGCSTGSTSTGSGPVRTRRPTSR